MQNTDTKVKESIEDLIEKFPQLKSQKSSGVNDYHLVRSVRNGEFNFEIQLYSEPDSLEVTQKILVLIDSEKECFSVPFFSNNYKDYWEFPFDTPIPNVAKTNSTFTTELGNAFEKIVKKSNDSKVTKDKNVINYLEYRMVDELFYSVLNCAKIEEKDSVLVCKTIGLNRELPDEDDAASFVRLKKNYDYMWQEWRHPKQNQTMGNCFFDDKNSRIYQISTINNKLQIKAYRQDMGFTFITM